MIRTSKGMINISVLYSADGTIIFQHNQFSEIIKICIILEEENVIFCIHVSGKQVFVVAL